MKVLFLSSLQILRSACESPPVVLGITNHELRHPSTSPAISCPLMVVPPQLYSHLWGNPPSAWGRGTTTNAAPRKPRNVAAAIGAIAITARVVALWGDMLENGHPGHIMVHHTQ